MSRRAACYETAPPWIGDASASRFGEAVMPLTNYMITLALFFEGPLMNDLAKAIEIRSMACIALQLETASHEGRI